MQERRDERGQPMFLLPAEDRTALILDVRNRTLTLIALILDVRNRTLTLIEMEDDTRSWDNFLVYFSNNVMSI
jgi:hypothetical protein